MFIKKDSTNSPSRFKRIIASYWDGFLHVIYPSHCIVCDVELSKSEQSICIQCDSNLQYTYFESFDEPTPLDQLFWGRVKVTFSYSMLYYSKTTSSQDILKAIKYQQRGDSALIFGKLIGSKVLSKIKSLNIDALVPVPIHPKKEMTRGYNQSLLIAQGISEVTQTPIKSTLLYRNNNAKSQTRLGRFKRWDNVNDQFGVSKTLNPPKHIALIDDVITTGSTLESIIQLINKQYPDIQISVISLAVAN